MLGLIVTDRHERAKYMDIDPVGLPVGDITVDVAFSSLNYKDSLAILSASPVVREYPMVPGIDLVGMVAESRGDNISIGDWIVVNGWGLGETRWGGLAQRARVDEGMVIPLPDGITPFDAMAIGTAGYTSMLCVDDLEKQGLTPDDGPVLITGASGGVGMISTVLLSALGYEVVASSGKKAMVPVLESLGASQVIGRFSDVELKPLSSEVWGGIVDSLGSRALAYALSTTRRGGTVVSCGLAQGMDLPTTVAPFILRAVALIGIDSVYQPLDKRVEIWSRLESELNIDSLRDHVTEVGLEEVVEVAERQLEGELSGRVVVRCDSASPASGR